MFENKLFALLKSRKFWAAALGVIGVILVESGGMDPALAGQVIEAIMAIIGAYIVGTALEDGLSRRA